jgi:excisionase family DNA binding protein
MGIEAGASYLGVSHWTLRRWLRLRLVPYTRLGRRLVVSKEDLDALLAAGRVDARGNRGRSD